VIGRVPTLGFVLPERAEPRFELPRGDLVPNWSQMTVEGETKTPSDLVGLTGFEPATT